MQDCVDKDSRADAAAGRPKSMRVLVIEDDRETAHFLQKSLKESGHAADLAGDGETGLSKMTERRLIFFRSL
jgi:CheY-like chemotaxis protein